MDRGQTRILELEDPNVFLTNVPDTYTAADLVEGSPSMRLIHNTPNQIPTRMGLVGELDVINGIMDKMRGKIKKINPESPRTKQALDNLGINKEECTLKRYENFEIASKNEKMKKLLYIYYLGHVNDTINEVLIEREQIKQIKRGKRSFNADLEPAYAADQINFPSSVKSARTNFMFMDHDKKLERMDEKNLYHISAIERQAMNFLASERDYLKKMNRAKRKMEAAEIKKKKMDEKRDAELAAQKEKYEQTVEKAKQKEQERQRSTLKEWRKQFNATTKSAKEMKTTQTQEMLAQAEEHRNREAQTKEAQRKAQERIERRNYESLRFSEEKMEEYLSKQMRAQMVLEKERARKRSVMDSWTNKFNSTRENFLSPKAQAEMELYTSYGERMKKYDDAVEKMHKTQKTQFGEKKKEWEEQMKKVQERLKRIEATQNEKEEKFEEKMFNETSRLEKFYTGKNHMNNQKIDLNKFRLQRTQIHFEKVMADNVHKSNVIMNKNKALAIALQQKEKERESIRTASIQSRLNLKIEKESLNGHLEEVGKVHMRTDHIARKFKRKQAPFNMQTMADFISNNFRKTPELVKQDTLNDA